ncbi:hypothetical protein HK105_201720 [Polyrhizophydium stewartii]|uniref:Bromo domain-containing protein n=1 Tax=Polyrhizophydium stewartii TaxID=2732419 RepID=A0ABR4NHE0_9FUNG
MLPMPADSLPIPLPGTRSQAISLRGHLAPIYSVIFDHTGSRLVTGGDDALVKVWDMRTGWLMETIRAHQTFLSTNERVVIIDVALDHANKLLATVANDQYVRLWNFDTFAPVQSLHVGKEITTISFSPSPDPDNRCLLVTCVDSKSRVFMWNETHHMFNPFPFVLQCGTISRDQVSSSSFNRTGTRFATGGSDGIIYLFAILPRSLVAATGGNTDPSLDPTQPRLIKQFDSHKSRINDVCFSNRGDKLLSGGKDGVVAINYFCPKTAAWATITIPPILKAASAMPAARGPGLASSAAAPPAAAPPAQPSVAAAGLQANGAQPPTASSLLPLEVSAICWNADASCVIVTYSDFSIRVFDALSGACISIMAKHTALVITLCPHPTDRRIVVSAGLDGKAHFWDIFHGRPVQSFEFPDSLLEAQFSPDGAQLALVDMSGSAHVYALGADTRRLQMIPEYQYFAKDWKIVRPADQHGGLVDEEAQIPAHLVVQGPLMDQSITAHHVVYQQRRQAHLDWAHHQYEQSVETLAADLELRKQLLEEERLGLLFEHRHAAAAASELIDMKQLKKRRNQIVESDNDADAPDAPDMPIVPLPDSSGDEYQGEQDDEDEDGASGSERFGDGDDGDADGDDEFVLDGGASGAGSSALDGGPSQRNRSRTRRAQGGASTPDRARHRGSAPGSSSSRKRSKKHKRSSSESRSKRKRSRQERSSRRKRRRGGGTASGDDGIDDDDAEIDVEELGSGSEMLNDDEEEAVMSNGGDGSSSAASEASSFDMPDLGSEPSASSESDESDLDLESDDSDAASAARRKARKKASGSHKAAKGKRRGGAQAAPSAAAAAPARNGTASKSKSSASHKRKGKQRASPPAADEALDVSRPREVSPWVSVTRQAWSPYLPQVGDTVAYIRTGHEQFIATSDLKSVDPTTLPPVVFAVVSALDFVPGPTARQPVVCNATLSVLAVAAHCEGNPASPADLVPLADLVARGEAPATAATALQLSYYDLDQMPDFLILFDDFAAGMQTPWAAGDRTVVRYGPDEYEGTVREIRADDELWAKYTVEFGADDMDGFDAFSPWELRPADTDPRAFTEHLSVAQARRVQMLVDAARARDEMAAFVDPVPYDVFPTYLDAVAYPAFLALVKERLASGFYRRLASVAWDVRRIRINAFLFNEPESEICVLAEACFKRLEAAIEDESCSALQWDVDEWIREDAEAAAAGRNGESRRGSRSATRSSSLSRGGRDAKGKGRRRSKRADDDDDEGDYGDNSEDGDGDDGDQRIHNNGDAGASAEGSEVGAGRRTSSRRATNGHLDMLASAAGVLSDGPGEIRRSSRRRRSAIDDDSDGYADSGGSGGGGGGGGGAEEDEAEAASGRLRQRRRRR